MINKKKLYTKAILKNNDRKTILRLNIFNDRFNTNNDKNYKFNFRLNIEYMLIKFNKYS